MPVAGTTRKQEAGREGRREERDGGGVSATFASCDFVLLGQHSRIAFHPQHRLLRVGRLVHARAAVPPRCLPPGCRLVLSQSTCSDGRCCPNCMLQTGLLRLFLVASLAARCYRFDCAPRAGKTACLIVIVCHLACRVSSRGGAGLVCFVGHELGELRNHELASLSVRETQGAIQK